MWRKGVAELSDTGSSDVAQADHIAKDGPKLLILVPPPPKC